LTTYANLIHVKPSVTVKPTSSLTFLAAGSAGRWTGAYGQIRAVYAFNSHLTGAIEAVYFGVGSTIRRAGGHNSDYVGVELNFGW
jgi:hypothetical protein